MAQHKSPADRRIGILAALFVALFVVMIAVSYAPWRQTAEPAGELAPAAAPVRAVLELKDGPVAIELRPDLAPQNVAQVKTLIEQGFYDGLVFHRVIGGFMAQTGDPTGTGRGGSDLPDLSAEFSDVPFTRGIIGMARTQNPNSANSQFFIMLGDAPHLNGQYTVIGAVVSGMEHVDAIKQGNPANNGLVEDPDSIVSFRIVEAEDAATEH